MVIETLPLEESNVNETKWISFYLYECSHKHVQQMRPDASPTSLTWKSSKQDIVADFTCESEYIAACEASKEAIWMKNFIGDLGFVLTVQDLIEIFCNNESAVALTKEPKDHGKLKHIERKYHFVQSKVEEGHVIMKHIRSKDNPTHSQRHWLSPDTMNMQGV
ncbi:hypothetical protein Tco_1216199 [Tanacetum coccineum]